ncbi:MAG: TRAP transporter small permease [Alphaproteobacteria bacterium]|nr:TRAP transporter small permease [Alphaproteobacteria bacterium]
MAWLPFHVVATMTSTLRRAVVGYATIGGVVLLGMVGLAAYSVASDLIAAQPLPWLVEVVEMGSAIAMFAYLPYATLTQAHVVVRLIPYRHATARWIDRIVWGLSTGAVLILMWRMGKGFLTQYNATWTESTFILGIPLWVAGAPILLGLLLWLSVCFQYFLMPPAQP